MLFDWRLYNQLKKVTDLYASISITFFYSLKIRH